MSLISCSVKGDYGNAKKFLKKIKTKKVQDLLNKYGQKGVEALSGATPVRTGKTAASWFYRIETSVNQVSIVWDNSNKVKGYSIAILLQYGHATKGGGYVQGRDYINPAIQPVFDEIAEEVGRFILE